MPHPCRRSGPCWTGPRLAAELGGGSPAQGDGGGAPGEGAVAVFLFRSILCLLEVKCCPAVKMIRVLARSQAEYFSCKFKGTPLFVHLVFLLFHLIDRPLQKAGSPDGISHYSQQNSKCCILKPVCNQVFKNHSSSS